MKVKILGDGLLGGELAKQTDWEVCSRKTGFDINNIEKTLGSIPDVIVNCIAHTDTYSSDREKHWNVNYKFVSNLVDFCNHYNVKLVHISSDYLYANSFPNASETDVPVHCGTWYGYTKLLADGHVQLKSSNYLLIRATHKPTPFPYDKAWVNQTGNFDYVDKIGELIIQLVINNETGLYNVGTETKTMYELAEQTNPNVLISWSDNKLMPTNTTMNVDKLKKVI
jgi:dTDP-4-dehydrorhamnose reductase